MKYRFTVVLLALCFIVLGNLKCSNAMREEKSNQLKATQYYEKALELEKDKEYNEALKYYRKSLEIYEDEEVKEAYLKLLAAIGPM
ncbi:MAG: tetratricopeptide repeat protein [Chitinophagales bacterium]|nr:tetratricopeptide repeat protein [Chitinophagales bacterium]